MKDCRLVSLLISLGCLVIFVRSGFAQDTVVVQTLTYDSISRAGVYHFPDDEGTKYEKVIMQYRMRCHGALVSNSAHPEQGCGQWDYNCETYVTDSSRTDSIKVLWPSAIISNYPTNTDFPYIGSQTHSFIRRDEKHVVYLPIPNFTRSTVGSGASRLTQPLGASIPASRSFYVYKASELLAAGVKAGPVQGVSLNVANAGSALRALTIRIRATKIDSLGDIASLVQGIQRDTALKSYYYFTTPAPSGTQDFYFYQPFTWDGTSNILIEFSFTNVLPGNDNIVSGGNSGIPSGLYAAATENAMSFSGAGGIQLQPLGFNTISNEITIALWTRGDSSILPANSAIFEGTDNAGNRQVNAHLPWSDNNIYWDCGGAAGNYDRINKSATKLDFSGAWNHWAFTKNAVTGRMSIYLNGSLWATDTGKHRPIVLTKLNLGGSLTSSLGYYGLVSQFSIWNSALDSVEIRKIMAHNIDPHDPNIGNLVAYYKLNEGGGAVVADSSIAHASGQLVGTSPLWRKVPGIELHTNFTATPVRPNLTFLQVTPAPTPQITDNYVLDSVSDQAHTIIRYAVVRDDSIRTVDTSFGWLGTESYTRDEKGKIVDSSRILADDTIHVTNLLYYQKWAQKVELMSFVTPYGIGLDLGKAGKLWEFDATDYTPILRGWKRLSVERGSGQEELDLRFLFIKGTPPRDVLDIQQIWPMTEEPYQNILSDLRYEPRQVYLDPTAKAFKLRSMITGHGQEGEFIPQLHHVFVNSTKYEWLVRKVCSDNPLYPQGGTWLLNRSGWCPGAPTLLTEYELTGTITPGHSTLFDYGVKTASGDSRYDPSNQLVSYGAPNFALSAGIVDIERPSDRIAYGRINPACDLPIVVIRNNGSEPLTSLAFEYYVDGGPHKTFQWTGNLKFLAMDSVVLPVDSIGFWTSNLTGQFHVDISAPNGSTDEYDRDNHFASVYSQPPAYQGAVVINYKTNNDPGDNYYEVLDLAGNTVFMIPDTLTEKTVYYDSLALPVGCYTLRFHDDSEDGLTYWAEPSQGTGYLRLRQSSRTGKILATMQPEFGLYTQFDFQVTQSALAVGESPNGYRLMRMYPNPARNIITLQLEGYNPGSYQLAIVDELGRVVRREQRAIGADGHLNASLNLQRLARGSYVLRLTSKEGSSEKPFVVE